MGQNVYATRYRMGQRLAEEAPVDGRARHAGPRQRCSGRARFRRSAPGIPYGDGFVKNRYVGRTFIQPTQSMRQQGIRMKLNPLREVIDGRRVVVVDDSIVRGNTTRQIVADAARGRRPRGAHADLVAPDQVAVLLRDRHARPGRADRRRV